VIRRAEDRELFRETVREAGLKVPESLVVTSPGDVPADLSFPVILRPAFTLGGHGGGTAHNRRELDALLERALQESPVHQVLVEESLLGWDEFELELIRDRNDNVVVVCSIENLDPMGVHTGDSVTVAPQMTLSDEAYQELRDAAAAVIRAVGVECGGSNIQFARDRVSGDVRVIEMNPRVSRSSALASKATGYPIAKVAAKLAVGYTLDEIPNDLTGTTPRASSPRSTTSSSRCRASPSRSSPAPTRPRDADEVGGRGDGDRAHLHRGALEGAALARARRRARSRPGRRSTSCPRVAPVVQGRARATAARLAQPERPGRPTTGCG
jgi:carbamoylphosphate synthase large subunit